MSREEDNPMANLDSDLQQEGGDPDQSQGVGITMPRPSRTVDLSSCTRLARETATASQTTARALSKISKLLTSSTVKKAVNDTTQVVWTDNTRP